eukprot:gene17764-19538_t
MILRRFQVLEAEVEICEARCSAVCLVGNNLIGQSNAASDNIKLMINELQSNLKNLKFLTKTRSERLSEAAQSFQYFSDANDVESWIGEKMHLVLSTDCGKDTQSAKSLLHRHDQISEEIAIFNDDMLMLQEQCMLIEKVDNEAGEKEGKRKELVEIEVETDTEDEELVEKEVEKKVMKEFKVAQLVAKHAYEGEGLAMKKGEVFYLASKTNKDWWSVRRVKGKESGYVPAIYMKEIEPKIFKKPVVEKIKVQEKIKVKKKKTKKVQVERENIIDKRAKRTSSILRKTNKKRNRKPRFTQHFDRENVTTRQLGITIAYAKLKKTAEERHSKLEDAVRYFELCSRHGVMMTWINEQIRYLTYWNTSGDSIDVERIQKQLQKVTTEISANEKPYLELKEQGKTLIENTNTQNTQDVKRRIEAMVARFEELIKIKKGKEIDVLKGHGVEIFLNSCKEIKSWILEKSNYLRDTKIGDSQELIRASQRRHQNFEHELVAIDEKFLGLNQNAESLRRMHSSPLVEASEKEITNLWNDLKQRAAKRKAKLQEAYGQQGFFTDFREMVAWGNEAKKRLTVGEMPKDVSLVEELVSQHKMQWTEVQSNLDRLKDLVLSGEALLPKTKDAGKVRDCLTKLEQITLDVPALWNRKDLMLNQYKEFLLFNRDADNLKSKLVVIQKLLATEDIGVSVENVTSLMKQADELSQNVSQRHEKFKQLMAVADKILINQHFESESIINKKNEVTSCYEDTLGLLAKRKEALHGSLEFQQFRTDIEEFLSWVDDKLAIVSDECHRDLSNLQSKILKHQALQAEVISNQVAKNRLEEIGEGMLTNAHASADDINELLDMLEEKTPCHRKIVENDLASVRFFNNKHQLQEKDIETAWKMQEVERSSQSKKDDLEYAHDLQKFLFDAHLHLSWLAERQAQICKAEFGTNLTTARQLLNRHEALETEIKSHTSSVEKLFNEGHTYIQAQHPNSGVIQDTCSDLERSLGELVESSLARKDRLKQELEAFQFILDANELETWFDEKSAAIAGQEDCKDLDTVERLLSKNKAFSDEMETVSKSLVSLEEKAATLFEDNNPKLLEIKEKQQQLNAKSERLKHELESNQTRLRNMRRVYQLFHDAENVREWITSKYEIGNADGYGKDYEHWQALSQKFDDFKISIAAGKANFNAVIKLADAIIAENGSHTQSVLGVKNKLSSMWSLLMERMKNKNARLLKAGELHKFNMQVNDITSRLREKEAAILTDDLGKDTVSSESRVRQHDAVFLELEAVGKQIEAVENTAQTLRQNYSGKTSEQVQLHQEFVKKNWSDLLRKAKNVRGKLHGNVEYHSLITEINKLLSWCLETKQSIGAGQSVSSVDEAEEEMDRIDDLKLEIDGREEKFSFVVEVGERMVNEGHHATDEIQENLEELLTHREELHSIWIERKTYLGQSYDYLMFCREATRIKAVMTSNKTILSSIASPGNNSEDIEALIRRIRKLLSMIELQKDKIQTLFELGDQLIEDKHFAADDVSQCMEETLQMRDDLEQEAKEREKFLRDAASLAAFRVGVEELKSLMIENINRNSEQLTIDTTNIARYLRSYRNDMVELESQTAAKEALRKSGERIVDENASASAETESHLLEIHSLWEQLKKLLDARGRMLERTKQILKLKRDIDFAEAYVIEKERSLATDDVGEDFDECQLLRKKLERTTKDMAADAERIELVNIAAKELLTDRSGVADDVSVHVRLLDSRWENLQELANARRCTLDGALRLHQFRKDTDEISQRIREKITMLDNSHVAEDLKGVQGQLRKHAVVEGDLEVLEKALEKIFSNAHSIVKESPEELNTVQGIQSELIEGWEALVELSDQRQVMLQAAEHLYRFQTDVAALSLWMKKVFTKLSSQQEARNLKEAKLMLELHDEIRSELRLREEVFERVQMSGKLLITEGGLPADEVEPKLRQLDVEKRELEEIWKQRRIMLVESFELLRFRTDLERIESWLDRKKEDLTNSDVGSSLEDVNRMIMMHQNAKSSIDSFQVNLNELKKTADRLFSVESERSSVSRPMKMRYENLLSAVNAAKVLADEREQKLLRSKLFLKFSLQVNDMKTWISDRLLYAEDTSSMEKTEDLEHERNAVEVLEAEKLAKETQFDEVVSAGNVLIREDNEKPRVEECLESLGLMWRQLLESWKRKHDLLNEKMARRKYLNDLRRLSSWIVATDCLVSSDATGKDLKSALLLDMKHKDIEAECDAKQKELDNMRDELQRKKLNNEFLMANVNEEFREVAVRFEELAHKMQLRKVNLLQAVEYYTILQEVEDEKSWINSREINLKSEDNSSDLTTAQYILKKYQMVKKEIENHDLAINKLLQKLSAIPDDHGFFNELQAVTTDFSTSWNALRQLVADRLKSIQYSVLIHKFIAGTNQALLWLRDHLPLLESNEFGKDESTTKTLLRKNATIQSDLNGFKSNIDHLQSRFDQLPSNHSNQDEALRTTALQCWETLIQEYNRLLELCTLRNRRLNETIHTHHFQTEADGISYWIEERLTAVNSDDCGNNLVEVDKLLKRLDAVVNESRSYEIKVEKLKELVHELEVEEHTDIEIIQDRLTRVTESFAEMNQLLLARHQSLENSKVICEFKKSVEETLMWIRKKDRDMISVNFEHDLQGMNELQRLHDNYMHDINALQAKVTLLVGHSEQLGLQFPDYKEGVENVSASLEREFDLLQSKIKQTTERLKDAKNLKNFLQSSAEMRSWIKDQLTAIRRNIDRLLSKSTSHEDAFLQYKDHVSEQGGRQAGLEKLLSTGRRMINDNHGAQSVIKNEINCLEKDWQTLQGKLRTFEEDLQHSQVSESLTDDLMNLDNWLEGNNDQFHDDLPPGDLDEIEDMLKMHDDLEKSIKVQEDRFQSVLSRLSEYEENMGDKVGKNRERNTGNGGVHGAVKSKDASLLSDVPSDSITNVVSDSSITEPRESLLEKVPSKDANADSKLPSEGISSPTKGSLDSPQKIAPKPTTVLSSSLPIVLNKDGESPLTMPVKLPLSLPSNEPPSPPEKAPIPPKNVPSIAPERLSISFDASTKVPSIDDGVAPIVASKNAVSLNRVSPSMPTNAELTSPPKVPSKDDNVAFGEARKGVISPRKGSSDSLKEGKPRLPPKVAPKPATKPKPAVPNADSNSAFKVSSKPTISPKKVLPFTSSNEPHRTSENESPGLLPKEPPSSPSKVPHSWPPKVAPSSSPNVPPSSPSKVPPSLPSKVPPSSSPNVPPSLPSKVPPSLPSKVPPSLPSKVPPSSSPNVPPSLPSKVPPSLPSKVPPSLPSKVPPSLPSKVPPSLPPNMPPSSPSEVPVSLPSKVPPSPSFKVPPSLPPNVPPSFPSNMSPSLTSTVPLSLPRNVSPSSPSQVPPNLLPKVSPSLPLNVPPSLPPKVPSSLPPKVPPSLTSTVPPSLPPEVLPSLPRNVSPSSPSEVPPNLFPKVSSSLPTQVPSSLPLEEPYEFNNKESGAPSNRIISPVKDSDMEVGIGFEVLDNYDDTEASEDINNRSSEINEFQQEESSFQRGTAEPEEEYSSKLQPVVVENIQEQILQNDLYADNDEYLIKAHDENCSQAMELPSLCITEDVLDSSSDDSVEFTSDHDVSDSEDDVIEFGGLPILHTDDASSIEDRYELFDVDDDDACSSPAPPLLYDALPASRSDEENVLPERRGPESQHEDYAGDSRSLSVPIESPPSSVQESRDAEREASFQSMDLVPPPGDVSSLNVGVGAGPYHNIDDKNVEDYKRDDDFRYSGVAETNRNMSGAAFGRVPEESVGPHELSPVNRADDRASHEDDSGKKPNFTGYLNRKQDLAVGGKRHPNRSWKHQYAVVDGSEARFFDSEDFARSNRAADKKFDLCGASIAVEPSYSSSSNDNIVRLRLANKSEYLITADDRGVVDNFLMVVNQCTGLAVQDDSMVSLPPPPPPPQLPISIATGDNVADEITVGGNSMFEEDQPQEGLDESEDEFDDILPPAPIFTKHTQPVYNSRRVSIGLLDLVSKSTTLADNSSSLGSSDEESEEFTFDLEAYELQNQSKNEDRKPQRFSSANSWVTRPDSTYADETTPITPFGFGNYDNNDNQNAEIGQSRVEPPRSHSSARQASTGQRTRPNTLQVDATRDTRGAGDFASREYGQIPNIASSPGSPSKDHKKKPGFLSGIFRKKK